MTRAGLVRPESSRTFRIPPLSLSLLHHGQRVLKVRRRRPLRPRVFPRNLPDLRPTRSRIPAASLRFLLYRLFHL